MVLSAFEVPLNVTEANATQPSKVPSPIAARFCGKVKDFSALHLRNTSLPKVSSLLLVANFTSFSASQP